MIGLRFSDFIPTDLAGATFEKLLNLFKELLVHTSGDVSEALSWLTELDKQYNLTNEEYGMADFIQELIDKGYINNPDNNKGGFRPTKKMEIAIRQKSLEDVFGKIKKSGRGNHNTKSTGRGEDYTSDLKPYEFGDSLENIAISESIKNAQINHGIDSFRLTNEDLEVRETYYQSQMSTMLMIDISHSMILYGDCLLYTSPSPRDRG